MEITITNQGRELATESVVKLLSDAYEVNKNNLAGMSELSEHVESARNFAKQEYDRTYRVLMSVPVTVGRDELNAKAAANDAALKIFTALGELRMRAYKRVCVLKLG